MSSSRATSIAATGALQISPVLTRIEMHRVVAVIEKAIERLQLLTLLDHDSAPPGVYGGTTAGGADASASGKTDAGASKGATAGAGHDDASRGIGGMLEEQRRLEARYEQLLAATQKPKPNPLDPQLDPAVFAHVKNAQEQALLDELRAVSLGLKAQSKLLCRQLKDNPNDEHNWRKVVNERGEFIAMLTACCRELNPGAGDSTLGGASSTSVGSSHASSPTAVASYESFAKKVLEEQAASIWADELVKKEKETNQNVKQLQHEVRKEREEKEEQLRKKQEEIAELKTQLRLLKQEVRDHMDKLKAETEASTEAMQRQAFNDQRVLNDKLSHLEELITTEERVHEVLCTHTVAKAAVVKTLQEETDERATKAQAEKQVERARAEAQKESLRQRLSEKIVARDAAEEHKRERDEDIRRRLDAKLKQEEINEARYRASTKLQAAVKAFFTRQILVVLKKKLLKKKK